MDRLMLPKMVLLAFLVTGKITTINAAEWFDSKAKSGHRATKLPTGKKLDEARLKLIREAKETIYLTSFIFTAHEDQEVLYNALCKRAKDGLDVRLLIDDFGSGMGGPEIPAQGKGISLKSLRDCGMKLEKFRGYGVAEKLWVKHDKFMVADGEKVIMGGANFGTEYSNHGQKEKPWYDMDVLLEGPMACYFHRVFAKSWKRTYQNEKKILKGVLKNMAKLKKGRQRKFKQYEKKRKKKLRDRFEFDSLNNCQEKSFGDSRFLSIYTNPYFDKDRPILDAYKNILAELKEPKLQTSFEESINPYCKYGNEHLSILRQLHEAKEKESKVIRLYAPYFVPHKEFVEELIAAKKAGLEIHIITNSRESIDKEALISHVGMVKSVGPLIEAGINIHMWDPRHSSAADEWTLDQSNVFHKKGGVWGGKYAIYGSDNLDVRGQNYSAEAISITDDQEIVDEFVESYKDDLRFTVPLTAERLEQEKKDASFLEHIGATLAKPFM